MNDEPTAEEVEEAMAELVEAGLAERFVLDGVPHIRLTDAGQEAAAKLAERLGTTDE